MKARTASRNPAMIDINHLRIGGIYQAVTHGGRIASGEYLGIEVTHGDWMIILRDQAGSDSIPVDGLVSVSGAAA